MNANLNTTRRVAPSQPRLNAPTGGAARDSVYEAERQGMTQLAKAHSKVGEAVATCGQMLYQYDQHRIKDEYAADMRMLQTIYAEEYAKLNTDFSNRQFNSGEEFMSAYQAAATDLNRRVRQRITSGDPNYNGFVFRNIGRWEEELAQTAEVQAAVAMTNATTSWINTREKITMATNDAKLASIAQYGTVEEARAMIDTMKLENPRYAEYYEAKFTGLESRIKIREATKSVGFYLSELGTASEAILAEATKGVIAAQNETVNVDLIHGDNLSEADLQKNRDAILASRNKHKTDIAALNEEAKTTFYIAAQEEMLKKRDAFITKLDESGISEYDKGTLIQRFDRSALETINRSWSAYQNTIAKNQLAKTSEMRKAISEAEKNGTTYLLSQNSDFWTIVPNDDHMPDIAGSREFRFLRRHESPATEDEKLYNEWVVERSNENTLVALSRLVAIPEDDPAYFEKAKDVLEDLRLSGVLQENYAKVYGTFSRIYSGRKTQHREALSFFKESVFNAVVEKTSILSDEQKKEIKNFDALLQSGVLPPQVCDHLLNIATGSQRFDTITEASHFIESGLGALTESMNAETFAQNTQRKIDRLRTLTSLDPSEAFDRDGGKYQQAGEIGAARRTDFESWKAARKPSPHRHTQPSPLKKTLSEGGVKAPTGKSVLL